MPVMRGEVVQLEEQEEDIHARETYHCNERGAAVVLVALSTEMLANPASIRWNRRLCKAGPCRLAPSTAAAGRSFADSWHE